MRRSDLSPEFRLLIDASLPGAPVEIPRDVDWEAFLRLVHRHRLTPAVFGNSAGMPANVQDRLRRRARRVSIHALRHSAAMVQAAAALERGGVAVLAWKGAALSGRLFGDPALREVRDIDLLVHATDLDAAEQTLRVLSYERRWPRIELTPRMRAALLEREQHFDYYQARAGVLVELHWRLESWDAAALDWLWEHSALQAWPGGGVRVPDDTALLLLVVDHGARHRWFLLKWLADAAALLSRMATQAAVPLVAAAREHGLADALAGAARLVTEMYGLDLPPPLLTLATETPGSRRLAGEALRALLGPEADRPGLRRYRLVSPRDFEAVPLPERFFWLYYPLRPLLWFWHRLRRRRSEESLFERTYLSGASLYGDDFNATQLREWWEREQRGYWELVCRQETYTYGHHAFNRFHVYRHLQGRFPTCLAFGTARGDDVAPLAQRVDRFIAIEPAESWWSEQIDGTEARFLKPAMTGDIPLAAESVDLAVCFSVLHHVANASHVFDELVRVLRPRGILTVREPISTMGDWRYRRPGLTADERGFPPGWLAARAEAHGLRTVRKAWCGFPLTTRLARWLRLGPAYNCRALVRLDGWMSHLLSWNLHYHRDTVWKKIAPGEIVCIFQKPAAAAQPVAYTAVETAPVAGR